jgi:hypothetical protein
VQLTCSIPMNDKHRYRPSRSSYKSMHLAACSTLTFSRRPRPECVFSRTLRGLTTRFKLCRCDEQRSLVATLPVIVKFNGSGYSLAARAESLLLTGYGILGTCPKLCYSYEWRSLMQTLPTIVYLDIACCLPRTDIKGKGNTECLCLAPFKAL